MCVCGETEAVNKVLDELGLSLDAQVSRATSERESIHAWNVRVSFVCMYVCVWRDGGCEQGLG